MTPQLPTITMDCPVCLQANRIGILQVNRTVRCGACKSKFEATPDGNQRDVIRIAGGCSLTNSLYVIAFERKVGERYRFVTTAQSHDANHYAPQKTRAIVASEVEFSGFVCPCCASRELVSCEPCNTWVCKGAAKRVPQGTRNHCPHCGDIVCTSFITEVAIFDKPPQQNVGPSPNRVALPASSSLMKWRPR
jgi:hypothetical protein